MKQHKTLLVRVVVLALGICSFSVAAERPSQCDEAEAAIRAMGVDPADLAQVGFSEMPPPESASEQEQSAFDDMMDSKIAGAFFGGDTEAAATMFDQLDQFDVNPMDCGYFPPGMTAELMQQGSGPDDKVMHDDGSVVLDDGSVVLDDGSVVLPDGTVVLSDGTVVLPDGMHDQGMNDAGMHDDGSVLLEDGSVVLDDGTVLLPDGMHDQGMNDAGMHDDGSVVLDDGSVVLPDGTVVLPGGSVVLPDGTVVLPDAMDNQGMTTGP